MSAETVTGRLLANLPRAHPASPLVAVWVSILTSRPDEIFKVSRAPAAELRTIYERRIRWLRARAMSSPVGVEAPIDALATDDGQTWPEILPARP